MMKIIENSPELNPEWLLTGKGEMLKEVIDELEEKAQKKKKELEGINFRLKSNHIPLIPLDAMAGFGSGEMQVMDYDTETYIVPEFNELNVEFMIRVKGSSMYPKYNSGDIVACRKLPLDTFFQWNKVYVLDTSQGPMIKRIHKSNKQEHLLCISDNDKYKPFDIPLTEIYSLAIVVGVIRLE